MFEDPTVTLVRGLAQVVDTHALSELIVDTPELTLTLRRHVPWSQPSPGLAGPPMAAVAPPVMAAPLPATVTVQAESRPPAESAPAPAAAVDKHHVVTSPFVGTFYRRPNPDASPYVEIGARVSKGQCLCIIEAMKLMNEIEAEESGTIVAVLVEDSEPVEYGQPLFKIDPA